MKAKGLSLISLVCLQRTSHVMKPKQFIHLGTQSFVKKTSGCLTWRTLQNLCFVELNTLTAGNRTGKLCIYITFISYTRYNSTNLGNSQKGIGVPLRSTEFVALVALDGAATEVAHVERGTIVQRNSTIIYTV